ncbi:MAG: ribosome biogenesis GTPase Der [Patescibacteria group bacterium]|nr:ribosome biogenesis GTPase Der [Patescibacteria group bacterium]
MPSPRTRKLPIVALVGRANVGKSTLWNKLTETGQAIVSATPHTTRDRKYGTALWRGEAIEVVDTGGLDISKEDAIGKGMHQQLNLALKDADVVLFMIDAREGIMPQEVKAAEEIGKLKKEIILVANKVDHLKHIGQAFSKEVYGLNLGEPVACSASTGKGVGDLLDLVYDKLIAMGRPPVDADELTGLKIVVMGRPNVGKSSIVNAILGEERVIVSPVAHTTREPIDTHLVWKDQPIVLVDTAGIRRASRIKEKVDEASLERNKNALRRADIAFLVLDVTEPPGQQDKQLAGLMKDQNKGLVIVANKWDLVDDKSEATSREFESRIRMSFPFLAWAPIIFMSGKSKQRVGKLMDMALQIRDERRRTIDYNALQRVLKSALTKKKPLADLGNFSPYVHDVEQLGIEPPAFRITVRGQKQNLASAWVRFFENRLREKFGFVGTPIDIKAYNAPMGTLEEQEKDFKGKRIQRRKRPIGRKGHY